MRRSVLLFAITFAACLAAAEERDGSGSERAIIVPEGVADAVRWEMIEARRRYPDARFEGGARVPSGGHIYDMLEFDTPTKHLRLIFDAGREKKP
jgi:hypothetical protein